MKKTALGLGCLTMFGLASTSAATATGFDFVKTSVSQTGWSVSDPRTLVSVQVYITFDDVADRLIIVEGKPGDDITISTNDGSGFFQSANGSTDDSKTRTSAVIAAFPSAQADSYVSIGMLNNDSGTDAIITTGMDWATFNAGGSLEAIDTNQGGGWLAQPDETQGDATEGRVFIGQFTVASGSTITGTLNYMYLDNTTGLNIELDGEFFLTTATPSSGDVGKSDFNGDGQDDVLWQCDYDGGTYDGSVLFWRDWDGADGGFSSSVLLNTDTEGPLSSAWTIVGSGDVDGDGYAEVVWRSNTGAVVIWDVVWNGSDWERSGTIMTSVGITGWSVKAIGDFNNDGQDDLMWQCDYDGGTFDGSVVVWLDWDGTDGGYDSYVLLNTDTEGPLPPTWELVGAGDVDNDGSAEAVWRGSTGAVVVWSVVWSGVTWERDATIMTSLGISGWSIKAIGDFDDDGQDDLMWQCDYDGGTFDGSVLVWFGWDGTDGGYTSHVLLNTDTAGALPETWAITGSGNFSGLGPAELLWRDPTGAVVIWGVVWNAVAWEYSASVMTSAGITGWSVKAPRDKFN